MRLMVMMTTTMSILHFTQMMMMMMMKIVRMTMTTTMMTISMKMTTTMMCLCHSTQSGLLIQRETISTVDGGPICPGSVSPDTVIPATTLDPSSTEVANVLPPGNSPAPIVPGSRHGGSRDVKTEVLYGIEDTPPWYLCILLGIQAISSLLIVSLNIIIVVVVIIPLVSKN